MRSYFKPFCLLILIGLSLGTAHALEVRVEAPPELATLLQTHLETARAARLKEPLTPEELERLQRVSLLTAQDLLATEGYFSPRIEGELRQEGDERVACLAPSTMAGCIPLPCSVENGRCILQYRVEPGPRTHVSKITIRFAGAVSEPGEDKARLRSRIQRSFFLKQGMPFRQADWNKTKNGVLSPLLGGVYPAARIADSEARVDPQQRTAELTVLIDSGPVFHYGPVVISGSQRYPEEIIRNLSPIKPGISYRQQVLLDYQAALDASGYYAQALVTIDPDPAQAAAIPIQVTVVEKPEKRVSFGVGVSTDTGARVQAEFLHRDILNEGLRLKLGAQLETKQQQGGVELAWPPGNRGFQNSLGLQLKRTDIEGQDTESLLLAGKRTRIRDTIETALSLQFQIENQKLGMALTDHNQALTANYGWTKRTMGRGFYPTSGYVLNLQAGGAAEALLSDQSFIRLYGRHTQYFRLGSKGRLVLRAELGSVLADSRDGIPTDFLFRTGGDNSVRGYAYQSLGTLTAGAVEPVRFLATGSIEYNYFFNRTWGIALFVDAGDAADRISALSPVMGVGLGARYRSPVGPLNLDVAYGEATEEFRLHFSLGVSF